MRLDKFLKNSRLIKRRTIAKDASESGNIYLKDKQAKAGAEVKEGDTIKIVFGQRELRGEIMEIIENPRKEDADRMFRPD